MGSLYYCSLDCAKLLCSYLCPFDMMVELHAMDGKHSMTLSLESENGIYI